ncbi:unnamed protein product [Lactuca saligna]|uniref:Uncharacterized protein n=1 Tax=Lactuca saligna TaxID=75948 RepID=A0AA35Z0K7_LACSI|nr:unnamed protein product [Lactuca saligna]
MIHLASPLVTSPPATSGLPHYKLTNDKLILITEWFHSQMGVRLLHRTDDYECDSSTTPVIASRLTSLTATLIGLSIQLDFSFQLEIDFVASPALHLFTKISLHLSTKIFMSKPLWWLWRNQNAGLNHCSRAILKLLINTSQVVSKGFCLNHFIERQVNQTIFSIYLTLKNSALNFFVVSNLSRPDLNLFDIEKSNLTKSFIEPTVEDLRLLTLTSSMILRPFVPGIKEKLGLYAPDLTRADPRTRAFISASSGRTRIFALPPSKSTNSSSALVEYMSPKSNQEDEDLEVKRYRIKETSRTNDRFYPRSHCNESAYAKSSYFTIHSATKRSEEYLEDNVQGIEQASTTPDGDKKGPSRSARRKKAKRQWKRELTKISQKPDTDTHLEGTNDHPKGREKSQTEEEEEEEKEEEEEEEEIVM